jgi:hypothetical protein
MDSSYELLCKSTNGKQIIFDPINSHTATHFHDAPNLRLIVTNLIMKLNLDEPLVAKAVDTGKIIGKSDVVEIDESDEVIYAMRKNREDQGYVPFTKSREATPSSLISIYLVKKDDSTYELSSAWIGEFEMPPFPGMQNANPDSIPYWSKRAFVWGSQEIIEGSVLHDCPW